MRQVKEGKGWRLGFDPSAPEFRGLIGGDSWSLELTRAELDEFCRLLNQLSHTMTHMATELMDEERLCCEAEGSLLWLEAEGYPQQFSLRVMISTGRRGEGSWPSDATQELIQAAQMLHLF